MKLDQQTAEALVRLSHSKDFQLFAAWLDNAHGIFINGAVMGHDDNFSPDVLRGRAQGLSIIKSEMEKAPELVGRIQKIS